MRSTATPSQNNMQSKCQKEQWAREYYAAIYTDTFIIPLDMDHLFRNPRADVLRMNRDALICWKKTVKAVLKVQKKQEHISLKRQQLNFSFFQ